MAVYNSSSATSSYPLPHADNPLNVDVDRLRSAIERIDADMSVRALASTLTSTTVRTLLLQADGSGSGIDADLLDGREGAYYAAATHTHSSASSAVAGFMDTASVVKLANIEPYAQVNAVYSVNGSVGAVTLSAADVGALPASGGTLSSSLHVTRNLTAASQTTLASVTATILSATSATVPTLVAGSLNGGPFAGFRNRIINGNFDVWERGASFVNPSGEYTADRWTAHQGTGGTATVDSIAFAAGGNPPEVRRGLRFAQSVAASDTPYLLQRIESVRTLSGGPVTLNFYGYVNAGTAAVNVQANQNFGTGGSAANFNALGDITLTTTPTRFTLTATLPALSGKTIGAAGTDYLSLKFSFPAGAVFTAVLYCVQLEAGTWATPFEARPPGLESQLCQRYFEVIKGVVASGLLANGTPAYKDFYFKTSKRVTPTLSHLTLATGSGATLACIDEVRCYQAAQNSIPANFTAWADAEL